MNSHRERKGLPLLMAMVTLYVWVSMVFLSSLQTLVEIPVFGRIPTKQPLLESIRFP